MNHSAIRDLILLSNAFELFGQPKWTFGKQTCNTYEVLAERVRMEDGENIPAWPVLELIEWDEALTLLFWLVSGYGHALRGNAYGADRFQRDPP